MNIKDFKQFMRAVIEVRNQVTALSGAVKPFMEPSCFFTIGFGQLETMCDAVENAVRGGDEPSSHAMEWWLDWYYSTKGLSHANVISGGKEYNIATIEDLYWYIKDELDKVGVT